MQNIIFYRCQLTKAAVQLQEGRDGAQEKRHLATSQRVDSQPDELRRYRDSQEPFAHNI